LLRSEERTCPDFFLVHAVIDHVIQGINGGIAGKAVIKPRIITSTGGKAPSQRRALKPAWPCPATHEGFARGPEKLS